MTTVYTEVDRLVSLKVTDSVDADSDACELVLDDRGGAVEPPPTGAVLEDNDLSGPVPDSLGRLADLQYLRLGWNWLTGTLPTELTRLSALDLLHINFTGVCAPVAAFREWLAALDFFFGDTCPLPPQPVGTMPAQTLGPARGVSAEPYFSDPNDDPLTWSAASSNPRTVGAFVSGDTVWLVPGAAGSAVVTVTARDPGGLSDRTLSLPGTLTVDVSRAFVDRDGDPLAWSVSSSAPDVVAVAAAGARVTLTAVGLGTATIRVTATDPGGLSAAQSFTATVTDQPLPPPPPFTDDPIRPGATPIRAVHFTELRSRIDGLRQAARLAPFAWTDPVLRAGATPVRLVHLLELRQALGAAYQAAGRPPPPWTDAAPAAGTTPIRAVHITELRAAVVALE